METRKLGKNGPQITTIGLGSWAIGGSGTSFSWGEQDDSDSIKAIHAALDSGVNWIDTAAVYGFGHSEEVVGKAVQGRRDGVLLFTKCGNVKADNSRDAVRDLSPASIRQECEDSLRRLGTDHIDLYQFHWPDNRTGTPIEESWATMRELVKEGKVRYAGVSNFDPDLIKRCLSVGPVDSLQPPYSLLRRDYQTDGTLDFCRENGIGVIVYSPMQAGLLTGKFDISKLAEDDWRRRNRMFTEPQLSRNLAFIELIRPIAERHGKTIGQLAIAWVLMNPAITGAIVGARNPEQAAENAGAADWRLTDAEMAEIKQAIEETEV